MSPLLSIVVIIASDTTADHADTASLAGCLEALEPQMDARREIIVPYHTRTRGIDELARRFPRVAFMRCDDLETSTSKSGTYGILDNHARHHALRARGVAQARGEIVGLLEDHDRPEPHWCARVSEAHRQRFVEYAAVGGAIENAIDRPLNWAVYFCDFGRYQNPVPAGESATASDVNVAYKRAALESIRALWRDDFNEVVVNGALHARGEKLALAPEIVVYQHRADLRLGRALLERLIWGRTYGAVRSGQWGRGKRLLYALGTPLLPPLLLLRMTLTVLQRGRQRGAFFKALPLIFILTLCWAAGECVGYSRRG